MATRRDILKLGGGIAPLFVPRRVLGAPGRPGANDRIRVGVIGVGNRGNLLIEQLPPEGEIVALADCNFPRCGKAAAKKPNQWKLYSDYRKLLDDKNVDAVIVATTDHGRVLPCIHACQAGKDVYAEKPLTLYISEGRVLVNAARKYKRIVQVGSQQRSMETNRIASDFVRRGGLGKLTVVKGVNYSGPSKFTETREDPVPDGLNWDMWLSQTAMRPYNTKLHTQWMSWYDFSGGEMTNWGAHGLDQIQCALGMDTTGPVEFWPLEDGPAGSLGFRYENGTLVRLELPQGGPTMGGGIFTGEKGSIEITRNRFVTDPPDLITEVAKQEDIDKWRDEFALWQAKWHMQNWLQSVHSRSLPRADIEIGHRSISVSHLCNITRALNRKLNWNPETERFVNDAEADALLSRPRRKGYELPKV